MGKFASLIWGGVREVAPEGSQRVVSTPHCDWARAEEVRARIRRRWNFVIFGFSGVERVTENTTNYLLVGKKDWEVVNQLKSLIG